MSLYQCLEKIDEGVAFLEQDESLWMELNFFVGLASRDARAAQKAAEIQELKALRVSLLALVAQFEGGTYSTTPDSVRLLLLQGMSRSLHQKTNKKSETCIAPQTWAYLDKDIGKITEKYQLITQYSAAYGALDFVRRAQPYQVAHIRQCMEPLGADGGACYGLASAMVHPAYSPYLQNQTGYLGLNQTIYHYQEQQLNEAHDQVDIKKEQHTRFHFCPNPEKQAKEVLAYARQYPSTDFLLTLKGYRCAHACYMRIEKSAENTEVIWYMDPNYGAYSFHKEEDFIAFYTSALKSGACFNRYGLVKMLYQPNTDELPGLSWSAIGHSILTGPEYIETSTWTGFLATYACILLMEALWITLLIAAAYLAYLYLPFALILPVEVLTFCFLMTSLVCGYAGLLGPLQFMEACCYEFGVWLWGEEDMPLPADDTAPDGAMPEGSMLDPFKI